MIAAGRLHIGELLHLEPQLAELGAAADVATTWHDFEAIKRRLRTIVRKLAIEHGLDTYDVVYRWLLDKAESRGPLE